MQNKLSSVLPTISTGTQQTSLSPFYLFTLLRVMLGAALMHDALQAGSSFQMQRTVHTSLMASGMRCTDGALPQVYQLAQTFPELSTNPDVPTPFPQLPSFPDTTPSPTYEWFAVQLRWICAVLCYVTVVVSIVSNRLSGVLMETQGAEAAEAFQRNQTCARCVESAIIIMSLLVYVSDKAYDLYMQYFLSVPEGMTNTNNQWEAFLAEVILVLLMGGLALCSTLAQYSRFRNVSNDESSSVSML